MQTRCRKLTAAILILSIAIRPGHAQELAGGIRGTVQDAEFSGPVPLAVIRISEVQLEGRTSEDGHFLFESIAPGAYTVILSKSGYERQIVASVVVVPGQLTEVNVQLKGEFVEMEEYVVRDLQVEDMKTETGLLALRETSLTFQDSISRELMSKAGASDAAGALRLVTGASVADGKYATVRGLSDRYVGTSVNAIRMPTADPKKRAVQIDIFPSGVIDSMSVYKTFTPEHPGDWSGGGINIRTLSIPDKSFLKLSFSRGFNPDSGKDGSLLSYEGGGTETWGRHVNARGMPVDYAVNTPPLSASVTQLADEDHPHSEVHQRTYDRTIAFAPAMGVKRMRMPGDFSVRASGGYRGPLFDEWEIGSVAAFSYSKGYSARIAAKGKSSVDTSTLGTAGYINRNEADALEETGEDELKWSLLGAVGLVYHDNHKITLTGLRNRIATDEAQLSTETNRTIYSISPTGVVTNRQIDYLATEDQVLYYSERTIDALQIRGEHKDDEFISPDLGLELTWFSAFNITEQEEPDIRRFKNYVYTNMVDGTLVYEKEMTARDAPGAPALHGVRMWRNTLERNGQYGMSLGVPFRMDVPDLHGTYLDPQATTLNWSQDEGRFEFGLTRDRTVRQYRQYTFAYKFAGANMAAITEPTGKPRLTDFEILPRRGRPRYDEAAFNAALAAYFSSPAYLDYRASQENAIRHNTGTRFSTTDRDELWTDHFTGEDYVFLGPHQDQLGWYLSRLDDALLKNIDYDGVQALDSGYWMLNYPVTRQLKVLVGARLELTDMTVQPDFKGQDGPDLYPVPVFRTGESFNGNRVLEPYPSSSTMGSTNRAGVRAEISDVSWLRSMSLAYELIPNMKFRYNWSQTIARPTFRELTPVVQFDFADDEAFIGNSDLELVRLVNNDVRLEWFRKPGDVIAMSWFDKKVKNPIEYWDYGYNGIDYTTALNLPEGTVSGWEAEFRTSFGLPGGWPGKLTVGINYADIKARVRMPYGLASKLEDASVLRLGREQEVTPVIQDLADRGEIDIAEEIALETSGGGSIYYDAERGWPVSLDTWRPMINQPDYIYNLNITYDLEKSGTSVSLFFNEVGDTLRKGPSLGDGSAYPSIFKGTTRSLNLSVSQNFAKWWKFTFRIRNLTDPEVIEYYQYPDPSNVDGDIKRIRKVYKDGVSYSFALEASW